MQEYLNEPLLNIIIHGILFLMLVIIYVNSLLDRSRKDNDQDRYFSLFILSYASYTLMMMPWFWIKNSEMSWGIYVVISALHVFPAVMAYVFIGEWLISIAEEKQEVPRFFKISVSRGSYVLFALSAFLLYFFHSSLLANACFLVVYITQEALNLYCRRSLGRSYTFIMTLFIIPTLLLQVQEWWNYTPADIYVTLIILIIYSRMWLKQKEKYLEPEKLLAEKNAEIENARTKLVLSQIKPHFIYNTLSTITYLCTKNPEKAQNVCVDFAGYLRGNLNALDTSTLISFEEELKHIQTYLRIECVRFEENLNVVYDIGAVDFKVPVLSVEPLVENAVKHGICQKEGGGTVTIRSRETENGYEVLVLDDGAGFDAEKFDFNDPTHVGLRSVQQRAELLCGGSLLIESHPKVGTTAMLSFPKDKGQI